MMEKRGRDEGQVERGEREGTGIFKGREETEWRGRVIDEGRKEKGKEERRRKGRGK
jgi:hypothetical protein